MSKDWYDEIGSVVGESNSVLVTAIVARMLTSLMIDARYDYDEVHHNKYSDVHRSQCGTCRCEYYDLQDEQRLEAERGDRR